MFNHRKLRNSYLSKYWVFGYLGIGYEAKQCYVVA